MVFENGVKNIQAAAYNGARTVYEFNKDAVFTLASAANIIKLFTHHGLLLQASCQV